MEKLSPMVEGKHRVRRRRKLSVPYLGIYAILMYIFLYVPLFVVVLFSFSATKTTVKFGSFSTEWYVRLINDPNLIRALLHSFEVGFISVLIAIALGTSGAFFVVRRQFFGKEILLSLSQLPILLPGIIIGIALLMFFVNLNVSLSRLTILAGHVAITTPFVMFQVAGRLQRLGRTYEDASKDLGAKPFKTFFLVTLPMIKTAIIGGGLLAFTISFDEIIITYFLTGTWMTLPVYIYGMMRFGLTPQVYAISAIILLLSIIFIFLMAKFTGTSAEEAER
jgi:spermidine/putrescine transport system permease protein